MLNHSFAQEINGDWTGKLDVNGTKLTVVFHIDGEKGKYKSTLDSPDQGVNGIPVTAIDFEMGKLNLEIGSLQAKYSGVWNSETEKIEGSYSQGPMTLPLDLKKGSPKKVDNTRPQDPKDYPYLVEEIVIANKEAKVELAGTLTMPKNKKAERIVILISGSGPQNRDEEIAMFNHRPFLVLSDYLTRNGIAVIRYDDRGVAKSTGDFANATTLDFAKDVNSVVDYIQNRKDLKKLSIGLIGHSEGGMIAPIVAAKNEAIDFLVLLAGPGIAIDQLMIKQLEDTSITSGMSKEDIEKNKKVNTEIYAYMKKNAKMENDAFNEGLKKVLLKELATLPEHSLQGMSVEKMTEMQMPTLTSPWFKYFISYNPKSYLQKVAVPVLALNGTLDVQVSATENLEGIKASLKGTKKDKIESVVGMNHMFQLAKTGSVQEYKKIEETINPDVLKMIISWINEL